MVSSAARSLSEPLLRTMPKDVHPARTKARASALPTYPLAPVTMTVWTTGSDMWNTYRREFNALDLRAALERTKE